MSIELTNAEQRRLWAATIGNYGAIRPTERAALQMRLLQHALLRLYFLRYGYHYKTLPQRSTIDRLGESAFRWCNECGDEKPLNRHFWYTDPRQRGGFKTICKVCIKRERKKSG